MVEKDVKLKYKIAYLIQQNYHSKAFGVKDIQYLLINYPEAQKKVRFVLNNLTKNNFIEKVSRGVYLRKEKLKELALAYIKFEGIKLDF